MLLDDASKVSWSLLARILMFAPDIQTSLQSGNSRFGIDMQSLLFCIFQVPVHFRPISSLIRRRPAGDS